MPLARRRYLVSCVAVAAFLTTWAMMMGFSWSVKLGVISFAPWVTLIGLDVGIIGGGAAAVIAVVLWLIALHADGQSVDDGQIGIRTASLLVLGVGSAFVGRRLRESIRAQHQVAALQSALIDATLDGICLTDDAGNLLIANKTLRRLAGELGMPPDGTVPERLIAIAPKMAEPDRYVRRMRELAASRGDSTIDEFEVAGTGRIFRGFTTPVRGGGRVWTLREVTADRELDRMRDAFVATVSHELRTPLTSISGFLEMMEDEEERLGEAGRRYLDVIRRSTDRLHSLVEDLLLVAQIEAKRVELDIAPVDVGTLATRAVEAARPAADEKGVELSVVEDHPQPVRGDRVRLAQVIDNLVSNAIKFTDDGGRVTVSVEGDGDSVRLSVTDTGIGVPPEEQGQVFSRFFRATTATRRAIPGTGLGLAISRALVEQHGGTIAFTSLEGQGTSVTVTLPATP